MEKTMGAGILLRVPKSRRGRGVAKLRDSLKGAGGVSGVPVASERPVLRWEESAGRRRGISRRGFGPDQGDERGVLNPRGRYLQKHGTNQRVNGPGARVAHALEAPEHEPALGENGEEVEHGGSGKRTGTGAGNSGRDRRLFLLRQARDTSHQQPRKPAPPHFRSEEGSRPTSPQGRAGPTPTPGRPMAGGGGPGRGSGKSRGDSCV